MSFGHRMGRALSRLCSPVTYLYSWWRSVETAHGATYFIMPDSAAIFVVALAPAFFVPAVYVYNLAYTIGAALLAPFLFLSVLRVKDGRVSHARLLLVLPYWITRIPTDSEFDMYDAWEDPAPSGVAFTFPAKAGKYLHLGTGATANALEKAIGSTLTKQGWNRTSTSSSALRRPVESYPDVKN